MRKLNIIVLLLITVNTFGQGHHIGIQGGGLFSNQTSEDFLTDTEYRKGFSTGINYEYLVSKNYTIGSGVIFNQKGFLVSSDLKDHYGNTIGETEALFNYSYLSIPVKAGYNIGNKLKGFANLGLSSNILLYAKHISPAFEVNGTQYKKETVDVKDQVSSLSLSGLAELGASYMIADMEIFTSIQYVHDITTFSNENYFKDAKLRHFAFTFSIGLKYALIK
jgi:hypothetical protein